MSIAEGIAVGLSVYGAGLSTYLAREQRRRDKAQLQVSGNAFLRVWDDASMKFMVQIKATNLGLRRVEIHQAGFLEADGAERFVPLSELTPHEPVKAIEDGETAVFYYDLEDVIQGAPDGGGTLCRSTWTTARVGVSGDHSSKSYLILSATTKATRLPDLSLAPGGSCKPAGPGGRIRRVHVRPGGHRQADDLPKPCGDRRAACDFQPFARCASRLRKSRGRTQALNCQRITRGRDATAR